MVDPVGTRPVTQGRSVEPLGRTSATAPARSLVADRSLATDRSVAANRSLVTDRSRSAVTPGDATGIGAAVAELAAKPPVDLDRVAKIRRAIETDSYPIVAETIADRLIAIKLNWKPE